MIVPVHSGSEGFSPLHKKLNSNYLQYTGFTIQRSYMHPWFKWSSWVSFQISTIIFSL